MGLNNALLTAPRPSLEKLTLIRVEIEQLPKNQKTDPEGGDSIFLLELHEIKWQERTKCEIQE